MVSSVGEELKMGVGAEIEVSPGVTHKVSKKSFKYSFKGCKYETTFQSNLTQHLKCHRTTEKKDCHVHCAQSITITPEFRLSYNKCIASQLS